MIIFWDGPARQYFLQSSVGVSDGEQAENHYIKQIKTVSIKEKGDWNRVGLIAIARLKTVNLHIAWQEIDID